jgi:sporulation related protein
MRQKRWQWRVLALGILLGLAACSHEAADWKSASAADSSEAYQQFLTQHPKSANAAQARSRIAQLQEDQDWQSTTSADSRAAYEQFLAQHPDSKWAQEAHIRIENFAQAANAAAPVANGAAAPAAHKPNGATRAASASAATATATGGHYVQLGAFSTRALAESQWKRLSTRYPNDLGPLSPRYVAGSVKARRLIRLQVAVGSEALGRSLCAKLKTHAQSCVPLRPVKAG